MKSRRSTSRLWGVDAEEPPLNLTPLIDVVFVVLIIFILVAPMLEVDKVQLASGPARQNTEAPNQSPLSLHVQENDTIWMGSFQVLPENLPHLLMQEKQKHPNAPLQLFHDKKATFGTYQLIKNAAENAGFEELDVILKPGSS
jgi:biopolymer transport protein ExbD